jgi:hypothetical protein
VRPHSSEAGLADFGWHLRAARHHVRAILLTAASLLTLICWRLGHFCQESGDLTDLCPAASPSIDTFITRQCPLDWLSI